MSGFDRYLDNEILYRDSEDEAYAEFCEARGLDMEDETSEDAWTEYLAEELRSDQELEKMMEEWSAYEDEEG